MKDFNPKNWLRLIRNLENYTPDEIETIHLIKKVVYHNIRVLLSI